MSVFCKCGCGGEITIKPWHKRRGVPSYLHGHHKPTLGRPCSDETRKKISESKKGTPAWNKGLTGIFSYEALQKIKAARSKQVMQKGRKHSCEAKEKNRIAHLGKVQTIESNKKRSLALTGKPKTHLHKINIGQAKKGDKNPSWRGGVSAFHYSQDWTDDLRDAVRKRDGYMCRLCSSHQDNFEAKLDVHHIDYNKENCNPSNLITLCKSCHRKTNHKRKAWELYFNNFFRQADSAAMR